MSSDRLASLSLPAPIGLDDLIATASLLTRVDRKYVVTLDVADNLMRHLSDSAQVLDVDGRRLFGYSSLYFDTPELTCYHQCAHRRRRRFKVRRRRYLDSGLSFLEVKTRGARGTTVKERLALPDPRHRPAAPASAAAPVVRHEEHPDGISLSDVEVVFVSEVLRRAGVDSPGIGRLVPVIGTRYRRATLVLPDAATRVTVDVDLAWSVSDRLPVQLTGRAIIETKGGTRASPADRRLWTRGSRPVRISKFGTGLAMLRPDLPTNTWHDVLHRRLADTGAA